MEHRHHGKSSANFLDADEILTELDLKGNETFMDAGCGDGYIAIKAIDKYLPDGKVYAVDNYPQSINDLEEYKKENNVGNLFNVEADLAGEISEIEKASVDVVLMLNVFHGFKKNADEAILELKRVTKDDGRIAIMEFAPVEMQFGPSLEVRVSPDELEKQFSNHGLKKIYLNEDIGAEIPDGKSHYLMIFKKEQI
ncbi:class I SAM-dependent methyltransferase [uncultured Methanobrevibacter sp.]|uniref:class I SAM-dependent methyltransferase n=1 Tax=uncultured Methanobrevibacter sp. TaxID=253161 RepID=UPI002614016F|nr:methyltransferase domain-containing protein [uncultured Methanobrevibacter sp.]